MRFVVSLVMSEQLAKRPTIEDFRNSDEYVCIPDRNCFDAGEVSYLDKVYDENGNPVLDPKTGNPQLREVIWKIDKQTLERLAAVNNARNEAGDLTPISIGHNNLRDPDEQAMAPLVGVAGDYKVAWDQPHNRWMLRANYYIRKQDFDAAKTYPFTSIELHPSDGAIHPVSLIRRAPKRDIGAWIFSRDGKSCHQAIHRFDKATRSNVTVIQFMREQPDTEMNPMIDQPSDTTPQEPDHHEKVQQYMRDVMPHFHHITQHPFHAEMVKQYARDADDDVNPDDEAPVGEPNATPAEDAEGDQPPVQNAAAFPSATNTFMPTAGKKKDEPMQNARTPAAATPAAAVSPAPTKDQPSPFARDIQTQQYSRLAETLDGFMKEIRKEIGELKSGIETKERQSAEVLHFARCEQAVSDLVNKHNRIVEDPDGLLTRLKAVAPDKLQDEVLFFAKSLPADIAGLSRDAGFIRTPVAPGNGFTQPEPEENPETGELSPRRASQVFAFQRDHNLWGDEGYEKAKKECPKNYRLAAPLVGDSPSARN